MEQNEQKLLEQNLDYLKKIDKKIERMQRYIVWWRIIAIIKIIVIITSIILAVIYLPPAIRETIKVYQDILKIGI